MEIIGYHTKDNRIFNSDGESCDDKMKVVDFLLASKPNCIKVFYHMDYNVAQILAMLEMPQELCKQLYDTKDMYCDGYKFSHVPGKYFSIKDLKARDQGANDTPFTNFGDASQYVDNVDYLSDDGANKAKEIGTEAYESFKAMGLNPRKLTSPIKLWQEEVLSKMDLPTVDDYPDEVGQYAYACCHGGWLETFKKGHYDVLDYDIRSAYAANVANLYDTRHGVWIESDSYEANAVYGFVLCDVNIQSWFSPIIFSIDVNQGESFTPTGKRPQILPKHKIDFINQYNIGEAEVKHGWWWIPERNPDTSKYRVYRPLKPKIYELYELKESSTGMLRENTKRVMNGVYGKFLEIFKDRFGKDRFGDNFNPVWGSISESQTLIQVAKFVMDNNLIDYLLSIAVDGVMIDNSAGLDLSSCTGLSIGGWKLTAKCPAFVISSGVVAVKDKIAVSEFSANYDWLYEQIQDNPEVAEYKQTKLSPVTLAKAVNGGMFDKLGQLIEITKTIDVTYESKRLYKDKPQNGGELLKNKHESEPLDISMIGNLA